MSTTKLTIVPVTLDQFTDNFNNNFTTKLSWAELHR